jgi:hypothetical protein
MITQSDIALKSLIISILVVILNFLLKKLILIYNINCYDLKYLSVYFFITINIIKIINIIYK